MLAIARCAVRIADGRTISMGDERELLRAALWLNFLGTWRYCGDAALVFALGKIRDTGRSLDPVDVDRLNRISRRAYAVLERLDVKASP